MPARRSALLTQQRILLCLAAGVAILPLLLRGPSCGHDFDFHLLSWLEAANQFAHFGYPQWADTPAWNAGEPRFIFYPPLSWALGGLLGLMLPWNFVPAAFTWIALSLSGLTMHRLASRYAPPHIALVAAIFYLANPYMLFTAYERTAYGELLAAAWLPLLFAAALPPPEGDRLSRDAGAASLSARPILALAVPLALVWLTNAPAAVMATYALAFLTVVRLLMRRVDTWALSLCSVAGTALGLALPAFYLLPAIYEQRWVQINMAVIPGMRPEDHFLFHRIGLQTPDALFQDDVVRTASLISLTLLAAIAATLFTAYRRRHPEIRVLTPVACLTVFIAFLLTPLSLPLWHLIPKLAFLQFPWRLCALLAVMVGTTLALALRNVHNLPGPWTLAPASILAVVLIVPAYRLFHQTCDTDDDVRTRVALFHTPLGTEPTDEYTPTGADGDALQPGDPPYWLIPICGSEVPVTPDDSECDINDAPPHNLSPGPAPHHLTLTLQSPQNVVFNLRSFPSWRVALDHQTIDTLLLKKRKDGLLYIPLLPGTYTIDVTPIRTPDRTGGLALSAIAALVVLVLTRRRPA